MSNEPSIKIHNNWKVKQLATEDIKTTFCHFGVIKLSTKGYIRDTIKKMIWLVELVIYTPQVCLDLV